MTAADYTLIRQALEQLPAACRYHGTRLDGGRPGRDACCDTGRPSRLRRDALAHLDQAQAQLANEEHVAEERGRWLSQVDAALIRAGQDEGGGYIAYARRIDDLATERDRLSAGIARVRQYCGPLAEDSCRVEARVTARDVGRWANADGSPFGAPDPARTEPRSPEYPTGSLPVDRHAYLSTACLHGEHDYCKADTGLSGAKRASRCKWCDALCQCPICNHQADDPGQSRTVPDAADSGETGREQQ